MTEFSFRKSSYSGGEPQHECVEVAVNVPGTVAVRDSKDPARAHICCSPTPWAAFTSAVAQGRLGQA